MAQYRHPQTMAELEEARARAQNNTPGLVRPRQEGMPRQQTPGAYQVETSPRFDPQTGNITKQYVETSPSDFSMRSDVGMTQSQWAVNDHTALRASHGQGLVDRTMFMTDIGGLPSNEDLNRGRKFHYMTGAKIAGTPRDMPLDSTLRGNLERDRAINAGFTKPTGTTVTQPNASQGASETETQVAPTTAPSATPTETSPTVPTLNRASSPSEVQGDASTRFNRAGFSTPQGPQGAQGAPGYQGMQGPEGAAGEQMKPFSYSPSSFATDSRDGLEAYNRRLELDIFDKFGIADLGPTQKEVAREYGQGSDQGLTPGKGYGVVGNPLMAAGTWSRLADAKVMADAVKGVEEMTVLRQQQKFAKKYKIPLKTVQDPKAAERLFQKHGYTGVADIDKKTVQKEAKELVNNSRKQGKLAGKFFRGTARLLGRAAGPVGWAAMGIEVADEIEASGLKKANDMLVKSDYAPMVVGDLMKAMEDAQAEGGVWEDSFNKKAKEIVLSWNHIVQDQMDNPGLEINPDSKRGREIVALKSKAWTKGVEPTDNMKWAMSNTISGATDQRLAQRDADFQTYRDAKGKRAFANMGFGQDKFLNSALAHQQFGGRYKTYSDYVDPKTKEMQPHLGMSFGEFQKMSKQQGYDLPKHDLQNYWAAEQQQLMSDMRKRRIINFYE